MAAPFNPAVLLMKLMLTPALCNEIYDLYRFVTYYKAEIITSPVAIYVSVVMR